MKSTEFRLETPENVDFVYELAGPAARLAALLIDHLILFGAIGLAWIAAAIMVPMASLLSGALLAGAGIGTFVILNGYFAFMEARFAGQTPGKRIAGIRVMDDRGLPLTSAQALLRNLLRPIDLLPGLALPGGVEMLVSTLHLPPVGFYGVGLLSILLSPSGRRLGDWAAGVVVVRVAARPAPALIIPFSERHNSIQNDPALRRRIRRELTPEDRDLLWQLCLRRADLDLATRRRIFSETAAYLQLKLEFEKPEFLSDEKLVQNVAGVLLDESRAVEEKGPASMRRAPFPNLAPVGPGDDQSKRNE